MWKIFLLTFAFYPIAFAADLSKNDIVPQNISTLKKQLASKGLKPGNHVFLRGFKRDGKPPLKENDERRANYKHGTLELWMEGNDGEYHHFKTYKVCSYSGALGPKMNEGDNQSPEGFYAISSSHQFNPESEYHAAMNIGYPNERDRALGYTGGMIMIHGKCVSEGCFAMGELDDNDRLNIDEIYYLVHEAFLQGQEKIPVHLFPFPMTFLNMQTSKKYEHTEFWKELKPGYDYFERNHIPPVIAMRDGKYELISKNNKPDILRIFQKRNH